MTILVTGGAGFIGGNFIRHILASPIQKLLDEPIINLDKMTYAGNMISLKDYNDNKGLKTIKGDIGDSNLVLGILNTHSPRAIINFAAETHVDRSLHSPKDFIQTNIVGTHSLLQTTLEWWTLLTVAEQKDFRFIHISTDEVYGSLGKDENPFSEDSRYQPNNPYSASKAASDHLVRAYHQTYGLPVITLHCSNNYGPYQFPEKLIPLMIHRALQGQSLPVYGDGQHIRDWLYVDDNCRAIEMVLQNGQVGETYNIGSQQEIKNIDVVHLICKILDRDCPKQDGSSYQSQITFVKDRLGHDRRYAMNTQKITSSLSWSPHESFETGLEKTIQWVLENAEWTDTMTSGDYRQWIEKQYQE